jgi:hypothetical protein
LTFPADEAYNSVQAGVFLARHIPGGFYGRGKEAR